MRVGWQSSLAHCRLVASDAAPQRSKDQVSQFRAGFLFVSLAPSPFLPLLAAGRPAVPLRQACVDDLLPAYESDSALKTTIGSSCRCPFSPFFSAFRPDASSTHPRSKDPFSPRFFAARGFSHFLFVSPAFSPCFHLGSMNQLGKLRYRIFLPLCPTPPFRWEWFFYYRKFSSRQADRDVPLPSLASCSPGFFGSLSWLTVPCLPF